MKKEENIIKLKKSSKYSFSLTVPKDIVKKYGWNEHQKFTVRDKENGKIEIFDWKNR